MTMISRPARRALGHTSKPAAAMPGLRTATVACSPALYAAASTPTRTQTLSLSRPAPQAFRSSSLRMASTAALASDKLFSMKGRVALVTGGGSGIGLMATQALVANGAKVYITGRTKDKLDSVVEQYSQGPDSIIPLQADMTDKASIAQLVKEVESREQCLCILVNNAGIAGPTFQSEASSAEEMKRNMFDDEKATFDDWTAIYKTNVAQVYFATMAFLPLLQKSSERHHGWSGTVINMTSISGLIQKAQHHFQYNASKGAAVHVTRMLAKEIADNNLKVRVNSIAPGVFPSEMTTSGSGGDQKSHIDADSYKGKVPAGRPGKDEDMAQAVLFFAANQYLNGQTLAVDGGYTLAAGQ